MSAEMLEVNGFQVEVVRTNRKKTISVEIEDAQVFAVVPRTLPQEELKALIYQKSRWIQKNLQIEQHILRPELKAYQAGESFKLLGMDHTLSFETCRQKSLEVSERSLLLRLPKTSQEQPLKVKKALQEGYRAYALDILTAKAHYFSFVVGAQPRTINVRTFRARWGSCSSEGDIDFNWAIIMAPHHIVDYVVVHELCHLHHMDHSPEYWRCVQKVLPDYKNCIEWLKYNGRTLAV